MNKAKQSLPDFPLFDASGLEQAFGAPISRYLPMTQVGGVSGQLRDQEKAAQSMFFNGGNLATHGFRIRDGIDAAKAMGCLRALLCSFEPKHEQKMATAALAIHHWCDRA